MPAIRGDAVRTAGGDALGVVMLPGASRLGDADPSGPDRLVALPPASLDVRRR